MKAGRSGEDATGEEVSDVGGGGGGGGEWVMTNCFRLKYVSVSPGIPDTD